MRRVNEYKHHAKACRQLAGQANLLTDKEIFQKIADAWEKMAKLRESDLVDDFHAEESSELKNHEITIALERDRAMLRRLRQGILQTQSVIERATLAYHASLLTLEKIERSRSNSDVTVPNPPPPPASPLAHSGS
jgi:outer membrane PBP1 activator LpoA protein